MPDLLLVTIGRIKLHERSRFKVDVMSQSSPCPSSIPCPCRCRPHDQGSNGLLIASINLTLLGFIIILVLSADAFVFIYAVILSMDLEANCAQSDKNAAQQCFSQQRPETEDWYTLRVKFSRSLHYHYNVPWLRLVYLLQRKRTMLMPPMLLIQVLGWCQ
jgi:hypothetical protein